MILAFWLAFHAPRALAAEPEPAATAEIAPRPFTPEAIRDAMPAGTRVSLRIETAGQPPVIERWVVTAADAASCTITSSTFDAATGALQRDEGARAWSWRELADHAAFPAGDTAIGSGTFTGDLGTYATREYRVTRADGSVHVFRFALALAGPPAEMWIERDGAVSFRMTQIRRQRG